MGAQLDFGYPWWLGYGHLVLAIVFGALFAVAWRLRWHKAIVAGTGALFLWAFSAFLILWLVVDITGAGKLPAANFMVSGSGRVLDMGAGTGRSSVMLLQARPNITLVALDEFGESFQQHFGPGESPEERLLRNLKAAGVDQRATVQKADMRKLPFAPAEFDGIISAYAIDHLSRQGIGQALGEAFRVLKPRGEFLLMLIGKDPWSRFAFGPLMSHGATRNQTYWDERVREAGFAITESGMRPATLYYLARKP